MKRFFAGLFVLLLLPVGAFAQQPQPYEHVTKEPDPVTYAEVMVNTLNVRGGAAKDAPIIAKLMKGELVPVKKIREDKKTGESWVQLAWTAKAFVFPGGVKIPEGKINKKPRYEQMRDAFLARARAMDTAIQHLSVPRAAALMVRYRAREFRDRDALRKRAEELARMYSVMSHGEKGIEVAIVHGNQTVMKAFY